jgi:hypothetical protein
MKYLLVVDFLFWSVPSASLLPQTGNMYFLFLFPVHYVSLWSFILDAEEQVVVVFIMWINFFYGSHTFYCFYLFSKHITFSEEFSFSFLLPNK